MSLVASSNARRVPEYPHPDGSSVRLMGMSEFGLHNDQSSPRPSESSTGSETDPTRQKKINPRISVYIPSMSGMLWSAPLQSLS